MNCQVGGGRGGGGGEGGGEGVPAAPVATISAPEGEMDALLLGRTGVRTFDHYRHVCTTPVWIFIYYYILYYISTYIYVV